MNELIGLKILKILINEDNSRLAFITNKRMIYYAAQGECCSYSWFNDIIGVEALLDATVKSIERCSISSGRIEKEDDFILIQTYGYKIITNKGYADIIFRNYSNGFYGGFIEKLEILPNWHAMTPIEKDWSA